MANPLVMRVGMSPLRRWARANRACRPGSRRRHRDRRWSRCARMRLARWFRLRRTWHEGAAFSELEIDAALTSLVARQGSCPLRTAQAHGTMPVILVRQTGRSRRHLEGQGLERSDRGKVVYAMGGNHVSANVGTATSRSTVLLSQRVRNPHFRHYWADANIQPTPLSPASFGRS